MAVPAVFYPSIVSVPPRRGLAVSMLSTSSNTHDGKYTNRLTASVLETMNSYEEVSKGDSKSELGRTFNSDLMSTVMSSSSSGSTPASPVSTEESKPSIQGWMYLLQDQSQSDERREFIFTASHGRMDASSTKSLKRFTKVYAVLHDQFLLLYRYKLKSRSNVRAPLIQIAVSEAGSTLDGTLHVKDAYGHQLQLHLYDRSELSLESWRKALTIATLLTQDHLKTVDFNIDKLPRNSMYRGTLRKPRKAKTVSKFRRFESTKERLRNWAKRSLGRSRESEVDLDVSSLSISSAEVKTDFRLTHH